MKLIHTSDWHLGHTLHGVSREPEHGAFLEWLLDRLEERETDALIVAGDVFDSANPPASAQGLFYRFLADASRRCPELDVVVVAGNHDSASRLEAPRPLLDAMGIHVVGALPRREDGTLDPDRLRIPLRGRGGDVAAWCLAVPYLRPADLPMGSPTGGDPLIDAVRSIYRDAVELATAQRKPDQALLLTGHLYMVGGQLSELSERKILGGNEHALPLDVFEGAVTYVALGHLHRAQAVGGRAQVRYSGAPLPLSMDEATYPHQVVEITLDAGRIAAVEALPVPRTVEIIRIPAAGAARLDAALPALIGLQLDAALPPWRWPYLEVRLLLDKPEPGLRRLVEQLLADRPVRLLKIGVEHRQNSREPGPGQPPPLSELAPDEVFRRLWRKTHEGEPSPELLEAFHALVESVQAGGAA